VLTLIASDLRDDAIILDTSPVRQANEEWVKKLLRPGLHYLGFTPILNPDVLHDLEGGVQGARPDIFVGGKVAISVNPRVPPEAIKFATDLIGYIKAEPMYVEIAEIDGFMAPVHILPQILSAALMKAVVERTGWEDVRRFAGRPFAQVSSSISNADVPASIASASVLNKTNVLRVLDGLCEELEEIRVEIEDEKLPDLQKRLHIAMQARLDWWASRQTGNWDQARAPGLDEQDAKDARLLRRAFGIRRKGKGKDKE
jgi:prephenate dehydrogenase